MGTRLYPMTQNVTVLEQLAGVPAGTHLRKAHCENVVKTPQIVAAIALAQKADWESDGRKPSPFKEYYWSIERDIKMYGPSQLDFYVQRYIEKDYGLYDSFLSEGWGRVQMTWTWFENRQFDSVVGSTTDVNHIISLLRHQALDDRLDFDEEGQRLRSQLFMGKDWRNIKEEDWKYGEWVSIDQLEGLAWS